MNKIILGVFLSLALTACGCNSSNEAKKDTSTLVTILDSGTYEIRATAVPGGTLYTILGYRNSGITFVPTPK